LNHHHRDQSHGPKAGSNQPPVRTRRPWPCGKPGGVDPYRDARFSERPCDRCGEPYRGKTVYCSFECALADGAIVNATVG
jgi:hypothetical protein